MSAAPGLLVDLSAAQRASDGGAAVERCAAGLVAMPGVVRALLLDPAAPLPGGLHSRLFGSGLLRWNTATEVRRALASGFAVYVAFDGAAVPEHVVRLGVPVVAASSSAAADAVVSAARSVAAGGGSARVALRVAVVAAHVPVNVALVAALAARCDVEVFADDWPGAQSPERLAGTALAASYDGVVHLLATAAADLPVLRSARRVPGVLWLHDIALAGLYRAEAADAADAARALAAVLRRCCADRAPAPLLGALDRGDAAAFDAAAERRYGLLLTAEVVRAARCVVVPSAAAARRLRLDQGAAGPCPPLSVCDAPDPDGAAAHLLSLVAGAPVVQAA
ncbi:MAG TPA: hypothetical protein VN193_11000 [Candidatus Angelobacter sp.]|nr:hypothetical protein [Candidatus Angelobacter sp.]